MTDEGAYRVLVLDPEDSFVQSAEKVLEGQSVVLARSVSDAQGIVSDETIDVVMVGPSYAHEVGVAECSLLLDIEPKLVMLLVADAPDPGTLRAALRAGFRDVIDTPLTLPKLEEAFSQVERVQKRLGEVQEAAAAGRSRLGRVVTIMSPKGGAGKTVTSTNVALLLALWNEPGRVAIMDADLQFGDVCLALQLDPKTSMVDAAFDLDKLDEELLDSIMVRHESGLRVLPAPLEPALADEISTQSIVKMLGMMKRMFDYIVIDTAPFLDEPVLTILERSDDVLLVVDMDMPSVKNAKLALDTLRLINFPIGKIKLVLNRVNSKARLDVDELERSLDLKVMAAIPSDKMVPRSVNEGVPVVALSPRSRVARGFHNVVRLVTQDGPPEGQDRTSRSWFGG
ncbi:MAG: AAA family ATPase [Acidimicrobiia bacterium]|nr:AAA family ATPase [Acidimicrobiia bacterium]